MRSFGGRQRIHLRGLAGPGRNVNFQYGLLAIEFLTSVLISKPTWTKQPHEAKDHEGKRTDITSLYCLLKHFIIHELASKTEGRVLPK
jgi:hypothetical protein